MITVKLSRYDRFIRTISHSIFKIGTKLDSKYILLVSSKLLDYIVERNGCPKGVCCWVSKDTIRY